MLHVVALSGGKDSTAIALRLSELNPNVDYVYVCTPTGDELPEMFAHWRNLGDILGKQILPVISKTLNKLVDEQGTIPNWRMRFCTRMLKIEPYAEWLIKQKQEHDKITSYVGLRADEPEREGGDYADIPGVKMVFPMRDWGWGINDVLGYLKSKSEKGALWRNLKPRGQYDPFDFHRRYNLPPRRAGRSNGYWLFSSRRFARFQRGAPASIVI